MLVNVNGAMLTKGSNEAAGFDISSKESYILLPNERHAFSTGLFLEIENGHVGEIWPRSGLALKHGIDTLAGVIDSDFRGEVKVILVNLGQEAFSVKLNDRICQILFKKLPEVEIQYGQILSSTQRNNNGFGSSGI